MKKLLVIVGMFVSATVFAQSNVEDIDLIQSLYGKEKKSIVSDFIQLSDESKKQTFWTLYDEYESKRKDFGKKRVELLERYAANYENMDDETTTRIINETADLGAKTDKLIATYFKKFEKEVGAKPAAQFFQLEHFLLSAVRLKIFEKMPFVGEQEAITNKK